MVSLHGLQNIRELPAGSVLVTCIASIGKNAILRARGGCNQQINAIIPNSNNESNFLFYLLEHSKGRLLASAGITATLIISKGVFSEVYFAIPPLSEQRAIAAALSDADGLIAALEGMISKKRDLKQAAMQHLLTGKTRLPGFSGKWEVKRLGEVSVVDPENLGAGTDPSYRFNYISLEDVDHGILLGFSEVEFRIAPSRARRKVAADDILIATVRPNLKSHLYFSQKSPDWICSTGFAVVRCIPDKAHPQYVFQHVFGHLFSDQIEKLITGSNYPAISSNDVRALQIPMPPTIAEQTAIAEVLSDMDADLAAFEAQTAKARAVKQGMMQELLTGRVRLL